MPSSRWLKAVPPPQQPTDEVKPVVAPNVSMSDLRRLEQEKRQRERDSAATTPNPSSAEISPSDNSTNVPQSGIPPTVIPEHDVPPEGIPLLGIPQRSTQHIGKQAISQKKVKAASEPVVQASAERGFYPTFNDLDDLIIPGYKLDTYEQSVLRRLYRLSRGFRSVDCETGLGAVSKACNIARSRVQKTIASLLTRGLIRSLGHSQAGTKYRVLEQFPAVPSKGIPQQGIPQNDEGIPQAGLQGIPQYGNNKNNKDLSNTQTQEVAVRVGSKFTIEECRRYAQHLQSTGQGINNPGGYATTIHRTGEADELIERFLNPSISTQVDASLCPDCKGSCFYYPNGPTGGVAKCKHEKLTTEA
jgi:hypothetical protein